MNKVIFLDIDGVLNSSENIREAEKRLMKYDVIQHYDRLIDEDNDSARDSQPMQEHMDKWDGDLFISALNLKREDVVYSSLTLMHIKEKKDFYKKVYGVLKENGRFIVSIDKNQANWLDMSEYQVKLYPDTFQQTMEDIRLAGLSIHEHFETEFAYIFVCKK